jgi:mono/diheme cytochrome c family protein
MRRWFPFIALVVLAVVSTVFLLTGGVSEYRPVRADAKIIYREACAECHGTSKSTGNLWSPELADEILTVNEVKIIVREGTWRMPAFPMIADSVLDSLAVYVAEKRFVEH